MKRAVEHVATTGFVAETLERRWIACELSEEYLKGSIFRFDPKTVEITVVF